MTSENRAMIPNSGLAADYGHSVVNIMARSAKFFNKIAADGRANILFYNI